MGAAVAVLSNFDNDRWDADMYGAMSLASRLSALVKDRSATFRLAYKLWNLDNILRGLMNQVHDSLETGKGEGTKEEVTGDRIHEVIQGLRRLCGLLDKIHVAAKMAGLTNNTVTAMALNSIRKRSEDILELSEWFEISLEPEAIDAIFQRAAQEEARGDVYDFDSI
jgi:hypothetical protein